jgi:hypothetical protein
MWRVIPVNAGMAVSTDYERLSSPPDHELHPRGHCVLARPDEIGEFSDLVHLHPLRTPAHLAAVQQESGDQFPVTDRSGDQQALCEGLYAVGEDRVLLPPKRNTTEPRDQRLVTLAALHADLKASARPEGSLDGRFVLAGHLRHRRVILAGQGLEH